MYNTEDITVAKSSFYCPFGAAMSILGYILIFPSNQGRAEIF
jgi:hypothetical protein